VMALFRRIVWMSVVILHAETINLLTSPTKPGLGGVLTTL
jgi:hypothetical protein